MAALFQSAENSEHVTPREESFNEETLDQSCDVILVVEDGKEFKAHKRVLSEASPFFEKMLSSDMKESKEGMVRLEMFSESAMRSTLEFIYTGSVQILTEHNARDLIVIADYLFLHDLKTLAEEVLVLLGNKLNTSNCISSYNFSQRYRCERLFANSKTFILKNFTALYEANPEEFLNMSSKEIEMWISSDEIDVSAEEDVFRIILAWIDHDKCKRKKYFAQLFRQVRLVYVSRDFLCSDIVTNDLVKDNEGCLDLVKDAMRLIDSKDFGNLSVTPRKSLETPVIVVCSDSVLARVSRDFKFYFPREDRWCSFSEIGPLDGRIDKDCVVSCRGKLYCLDQLAPRNLISYNLYSNCVMSTPQKVDRTFLEIFVSNEDEMYALMSESRCLRSGTQNRRNHVSYILKYKPESNAWEDISLFYHLDLHRLDFCIVAKDNLIYFIGGVENHFGESGEVSKCLTDVHRYNLSKNQWDKVADIQEPKMSPSGAVANGNIFIAGRTAEESETCQCEVYNETTNEWQFIASFGIIPDACPKLLSVDGTLYALCVAKWLRGYFLPDPRVQCYDLDKNEWNCKTEIPFKALKSVCGMVDAEACSVRIFKGFFDHQRLIAPAPEKLKEQNWKYFGY